METSDSGLSFVVVLLVSAIVVAMIIRRRYGPVGKQLIERMGPWWPWIIKVGSIATMVLWLIVWITVSPERRAELNKHYQDNAPWVVRDKSDP